MDADVLAIERLTFKLFAFELNLEAMMQVSSPIAAYRPLFRQPAVLHNLAIVIPITRAYSEMESTIKEMAGPRLESLHLVDRYQGSQVAADIRALPSRFVFRDPEVTLTADEVSETVGVIVDTLQKRFGAVLRA